METETDVLVVGGGATGCGVLRDLSRRGIDATLVERDTLASGTSGRMHGLLHSGARYAVSDRNSARECMSENRILRDIAGHCIEDTGGLFVKRPEDPEAYFDRKLEGCRACDIPANVITGTQARLREPALADDIERAIAVPDAAIDPFRLCVANVRDAEDNGARVETHATVVDLIREDATVSGAVIEHQPESGAVAGGSDGTRETIHAEHVVNATGSWAGQVGALAGVDIDVRPSKGAMTVLNSRPVDTVINRCRPKGDGDILVPHETTAILGTTDELVSDPDDYSKEATEVDLLIESLAKVIPGLPEARTIRSYWGVRPLYEPSSDRSGAATDVTREHFVLDHENRDGVGGLTTVVGGKLTTYRRMAESVTDQVCEKLGVDAESDTAAVSLPGSDNSAELTDAMDRFGLRSPVFQRSHDRLGSRTAAVLDSSEPNPVLCQCEGVTRTEVKAAIEDVGPDLNAVRIRTRATMGPCQGGRCGHRIAAELHPEFEVSTIQNALEDLRTERWNGQRHALWGTQLSQAMLNDVHFRTTLNENRPIRGVTVDWESFDDGRGRNDGD